MSLTTQSAKLEISANATSSTVLMSTVNAHSNRPIGVVSSQMMGIRITLKVISRNKVFDARTDPEKVYILKINSNAMASNELNRNR
jgi:hypothetical protein